MKCPNCNFEISEIDYICPFCRYTIIETEESIDQKQSSKSDNGTIPTETADNIYFGISESEGPVSASDEQEIVDKPESVISSGFNNNAVLDNILISESLESEIPCYLDKKDSESSSSTDLDPDSQVNENQPSEDSKLQENLSSFEEHIDRLSFIEKFLIFLSKSKKSISAEPYQSNNVRILSIVSSLPFMFWVPYLFKKKNKPILFFANQSLKLTLFLIINSLLFLVFELIPFYKTVSYVKNGIVYFSNVQYIPTVIIILAILLSLIWSFSVFLNIYCSIKNKPYNFLPFKNTFIK